MQRSILFRVSTAVIGLSLLGAAGFVLLRAAPEAIAEQPAPPKPDAGEEVRALLIDAYVIGGWSQQDAEAIAEVKLQRMIERKFDGVIPGFQSVDLPGRLSEASDGVAVLHSHLTNHKGFGFNEAGKVAWKLYASLNDWTLPEAEGGGIEGVPSEGCIVYLAEYEYCIDGQPRRMSVYWNSACAIDNFVENPCVAVPAGCECPEGKRCGVEYFTSGACRGAGQGRCIRLVTLRYVENAVDCSLVQSKGGCADCSPVESFLPNCPTPILASCYTPGTCPSCGAQ
ncbi:MAG: hypothetical protein ACTS3F_06225 [Phycisphaerales bacterium]